MRIRNIAVVMGLVAMVGCHSAPVVEAPAPAPAEDYAARARADSIEAARRAQLAMAARADSIAKAERAKADMMAQEEAARLERMRMALKDTLGQRTYFEYDRAEVRPADRPVLARKVAILKANPRLTLMIAGHADERGSDEYNLALGARRAAAVRTYLVNLGIPAERLSVVSYGEERPLIVGTDESAWKMNRRSEYTPLQGFETLVQPIANR